MPFYRFSATSTDPDDGYSVIAPYVGTGRWLLLRNDVGVQSIVQLQAIPVAERSPNVSIYVASTNSWYTFKSAAASLPTDIAPTTGAGSWELNTAIIEVVPPYIKTVNLQESIGLAEKFDFQLLQISLYPYKEAVGVADRFTYELLAPVPFKEAIGVAEKFDYALISPVSYQEAIGLAERFDYALIPPIEYREAIGIAEKFAYSLVVAGGSATEALLTAGVTYSQSSVFAGVTAASLANMTDGDGNTGTGTNSGAEFIRANFSALVLLGVRVGGGANIPGWGDVAQYLNGATISASTGGSFTAVGSVSGVADSGANQFRNFYFEPVIGATAAQIGRSSFLSTSELVPIYAAITGGTVMTPTPAATGLTYSQSSTYVGTTSAGLANMTDGNGTTGSGTNNDAPGFIRCDFAAMTIMGVRVGGGTIAGFGDTAAYLNGRAIEISSNNGGTWTQIVIIAGVTDSGADQFKNIYFQMTAGVTNIRVVSLSANYVGATEFRPIVPVIT